MELSKNIDFKEIIVILEEQVFQHTGRKLLEAEKILIRGSWEGKDYDEIARESEYNSDYLRTGIAPQLWTMLSDVIGDGIRVRKIHLRKILLNFVKNYYLKIEASANDDALLGSKTKIYGELPRNNFFYGREEELKYLKEQITILKRRCIVITGVGGIGKSSLASKLAEEIVWQSPSLYEYIIWMQVENYITIDSLINEMLRIFNLNEYYENLQTKISSLAKQLNQHRCLLILDGFETLAELENYEKKLEYRKIFIQLTQEQHRSNIVVTTQLPLQEIVHGTKKLPLLSLQLDGLDESAGMQMLHEKGLGGEECNKLVNIYHGNPSQLEEVADRIHRVFGGSVTKFFEYKTTLIGQQIQIMLHQQFGQPGLLSDLQKEIMIYLAETLPEDLVPIPFGKLVEDLRKKADLEISISELLVCLEILEQRSLIEVDRKHLKREASYSLQPVVRKYILVDPCNLIRKKLRHLEINKCSRE